MPVNPKNPTPDAPPASGECARAFDSDGDDVDLLDAAEFQTGFTG